MNIEFIEKELNHRKTKGLLRVLTKQVKGADFASNDYLGIAKLRSKTNAFSGSAASRLISGNTEQQEALECKIAKFHQAETSLLFSSGYLANLGLCSALGRRGVNFVYDEAVHASIRDGLRLSFASSYKFSHNNLIHLEEKLSSIKKGEIFIIVESLYSMHGDFTDLKGVLELCKKYNAHLIVDEAHSVGVYGEQGSGYCSKLNVEHEVFARVVTFGKAFGAQGAAVLCAARTREYLVNFARPFIYTTAVAPGLIQLLDNNYDQVAAANTQRETLLGLIEYFNSKTQELGLDFVSNNSAIKFLRIPGNFLAKELADKLRESGLVVFPILSPTVKVGQEGLRIVLHSYNTKFEVDDLLSSVLKQSV